MSKLICISGPAQNGKDTLATYIKEEIESNYNKKALIIHFADAVKFVCTKWFNWDGKKDEAGRTLLQYVGTDLFRHNDENCWVNIVKEIIKGFGDSFDYVLIPDARFENELEGIKSIDPQNFTAVKVIRDNFDNGLTEEQKNHPSETSLNNYKFDYIIHNTGSLDDYKTQAETLVKNIGC